MDFVSGLVARPNAARRWFVVHPKGLVARQTENGFALLTEADLAAMGADRDAAHVLGTIGDEDVMCAPVSGEVKPPFTLLGLRELATMFDMQTFELAGRATHVIDWATTSRFCGRCGTRTESVANERSKKCPSCGLMIYPRIAPAIIVLVRRGEEALLARNARFRAPFYSTLAGFSEIGESLEQTLVREVMEEVGVVVGDVRYFGSQPWPFPNSLMLGFTAEWKSGDIKVDGEEISDAKWFRANELPMIPPPQSIARKLIDAWVGEVNGNANAKA